MPDADKLAAILKKAEALAGQSLGENAAALVEIAAQAALAECSRDDIPEEMEHAVAVLALALAGMDESGVQSVTRGDTSITYAGGGAFSGAAARLAPFRRLARLKEDA